MCGIYFSSKLYLNNKLRNVSKSYIYYVYFVKNFVRLLGSIFKIEKVQKSPVIDLRNKFKNENLPY